MNIISISDLAGMTYEEIVSTQDQNGFPKGAIRCSHIKKFDNGYSIEIMRTKGTNGIYGKWCTIVHFPEEYAPEDWGNPDNYSWVLFSMKKDLADQILYTVNIMNASAGNGRSGDLYLKKILKGWNKND